MNHFKYSLREPALTYIINGTKKVEGRLFKNTFKNICVGDTITFFNKNKSVDVIVTKLNTFDNFGSMLITNGIKNVTPFVKSFKEAKLIYSSIYKKEDVNKFGVLAIHIKKIENYFNL